LHGGSIKAESPGEGQGATFTVQLPLLAKPQEAVEIGGAGEVERNSLNLQGIQILVVDDEVDSREFVAFVLEQDGADVTTAASGLEALQILAQSKPDILLSDIGMPEMDGYALMRQVINLTAEHGGKIKAIALTAYAGEFDQQQALAAGFQMHLSKPIEPAELIAVIAKIAGK
jgi:CheY-like chemotaxis protein